MNSELMTCPVCGYRPLFEDPWTGGSPSDEICPCCGTQFGYDDAAGGDVERRREVYGELRRRWVAAGFPWSSRSRRPPDGWDPIAQMEAAGLSA